MYDRYRRACARMQNSLPVVVAGVILFVIASMAAGWIRAHAAQLIPPARAAAAVLLVASGYALVTRSGRAVAARRVTRCDADDWPDLAPLPDSPAGRNVPVSPAGPEALPALAPAVYPGRRPTAAPLVTDETDVPMAEVAE